jgi:FkbM family methyltransferase
MLNWTFIREVGPARWAIRYSALQFKKRILKRDSNLVLPTGKRLALPRQSRTSTEIYVTNANMDWGSEALFARFADPNRDFLDIGSHIGYYAVYLSPLVRRVYAFEPDPRNFPGLRRNSGASSNIEVVEAAVSSRNGLADFFGGGNSSIGSLDDHGGPATTVPITTVDAFLAARPGSDAALIKTDIEGHDLEALRGMERTVAASQPLILTECEMSPELDRLRSQWKYRIFAFLKEGKHYKPRLREFHLADRDRFGSKMLFLVPQVLHSAFDNLIAG